MMEVLKTWDCIEIFSSLLQQFAWNFQVFQELETEFKIFRSPFSVTSFDVPTDMQLKITDLPCDSNFKEMFASVGVKIYWYVFSGCPKLRDLSAKILWMFGTTYLHEQVFSVMSIKKTDSIHGKSKQQHK